MNAMSLPSRVVPPVETLAARFRRVRAATLTLCVGLSPEDAALQSMPDASPVKWHLAHTTWFFEQFVLARVSGYAPYDPTWTFLFNSYYQSVGPMYARLHRGLLSRPRFDEVIDYRQRVDDAVETLLDAGADDDLVTLVMLGTHHEQQHQELIVTDLKHLFSLNPLSPSIWRATRPQCAITQEPLRFVAGRDGTVEIGHSGSGFAFDNESPRHRVLLHSHALANRLVTNAEFAEFVRDGGYEKTSLWLSAGWNVMNESGWRRPLYWHEDLASAYTLAGRRALDPYAPVAHISLYEADAFARWAGARLPLEVEWESFVADVPVRGNFAESGTFEPLSACDAQFFGDTWEWTSSPYIGYPGYRPPPGAIGEYNGKFMCDQWVLRGGSCATPSDHMRATYRNFFPANARWQFSGIRLARDT